MKKHHTFCMARQQNILTLANKCFQKSQPVFQCNRLLNALRLLSCNNCAKPSLEVISNYCHLQQLHMKSQEQDALDSISIQNTPEGSGNTQRTFCSLIWHSLHLKLTDSFPGNTTTSISYVQIPQEALKKRCYKVSLHYITQTQ